jgi:O-acetyl-ADP-ribose deacetylase (regulator of RNase III)
MSDLITVKGDLLVNAEKGHFDIIVQGCNCLTTMGSGIARSIREKYPEVYSADFRTKKGDYNKLGNWTQERVIRNNGCIDFIVINAYTQYDYNAGSNYDLFEYASFELILQKLYHFYGDKRFGFPRIGMGLAGGNAERIMGMLEQFAYKCKLKSGTVTLVDFQP